MPWFEKGDPVVVGHHGTSGIRADQGHVQSKYTPERVAKICQALELGATRQLAAEYAGISKWTFRDWYINIPEFAERVDQARALMGMSCLAEIEAAKARGQWQAAAWLLERTRPDEYGRTQEAAKLPAGTTVAVTHTPPSREDVQSVIREWEAERRRPKVTIEQEPNGRLLLESSTSSSTDS